MNKTLFLVVLVLTGLIILTPKEVRASFSPKTNPYQITVSKIKVNITLHRTDAQYGLVYGKGFSITSLRATGFQIKYNQPTQGQGFYQSSGGMLTGSTVNIQTYINTNKPNGVYTGSAIIQYYYNGVWLNGPTVYYRIKLI